jgi:hypothetical protein
MSVRTVGWVADFRRFEINNLELVDQNSANWSPLATWLDRVAALRAAGGRLTEAYRELPLPHLKR